MGLDGEVPTGANSDCGSFASFLHQQSLSDCLLAPLAVKGRTASHGLRGVLGPGPEAQELKVVVVVVVAAAVGNSSNHRHHHNFENCHQNTRVLYQSPEQSAE